MSDEAAPEHAQLRCSGSRGSKSLRTGQDGHFEADSHAAAAAASLRGQHRPIGSARRGTRRTGTRARARAATARHHHALHSGLVACKSRDREGIAVSEQMQGELTDRGDGFSNGLRCARTQTQHTPNDIHSAARTAQRATHESEVADRPDVLLGSYLTSAASSSSCTDALSTPGRARTASSTAPTHDAHVMPLTDSLARELEGPVAAGLAVALPMLRLLGDGEPGTCIHGASR